MQYRTVRKIITPEELGVKGETAGDFLLDLQKRLPVSPLDIVLPNGMKLFLGREKVEIKLPKNKEIRPDVIEKIITEGTRLLLEENRGRSLDDRRRIKLTMSLGDNTVYFTQGHLDRSPSGTVIPMSPILHRKDDTFLRVLDSNFTQDMDTLEYFLRRQHNRTLGRLEEDRTQEIADKLGFTTVEKDDSIIDVEINGVTDSCMVTRLCVHTNEFHNEKELLESAIKTYRDILEIGENPLLIIGLDNSIDVTVGRDRKTIIIEPGHCRYSETIQKLVKTVIGFIITKDVLENVKIGYKEDILVEEESSSSKILKWVNDVVDAIGEIRKRHGHEITFGVALAIIPMIFIFFVYSRINPANSYFQAAIITIPAVVFAVIVTMEYRKLTWIKTFGQKKFPLIIWFWSMASYIVIYNFGYDTYLMIIYYIAICIVGLYLFMSVRMTRLLSHITGRLENVTDNRKTKVKKPSIFHSEIMKKIGVVLSGISDSHAGKKIWMVISIILRAVSSIFGVITVIIFAIAFLPMIGLFVLINLLNRGYWRELEKYREDLIEKAVHKYRDERKLAPSCRVIFKTTKCKKLKNPLSGSWNVLSKKVPRFLTMDGFVDIIDKLVLRGWI